MITPLPQEGALVLPPREELTLVLEAEQSQLYTCWISHNQVGNVFLVSLADTSWMSFRAQQKGMKRPLEIVDLASNNWFARLSIFF